MHTVRKHLCDLLLGRNEVAFQVTPRQKKCHYKQQFVTGISFSVNIKRKGTPSLFHGSTKRDQRDVRKTKERLLFLSEPCSMLKTFVAITVYLNIFCRDERLSFLFLCGSFYDKHSIYINIREGQLWYELLLN